MVSSKISRLFKTASGTILEWYDFCLFAYFAPAIGRTFFASGDQHYDLLLALSVFGCGFVARPFGGFLFGYLGDKVSRYFAMNMSIFLMGLTTLACAALPGYQFLGIYAPICLFALRILQGISAGGQIGNLLVILSEDPELSHKGFYIGIANATAQLGFVLAAAISLLVAHFTPPPWQELSWRLPFMIGGFFLLIYAMLLQGEDNTATTLSFRCHLKLPVTLHILLRHYKASLLVMLLLCFGVGTCFYITFTFFMDFLSQLHLMTQAETFRFNMLGILLACALLPLFGYLGDRLGLYRMLLIGIIVSLALNHLEFEWLLSDNLGKQVIALVLFVVCICWLNGCCMPLFAKLFPTRIRASGFCTAFGVASALCGFSPMIAERLMLTNPLWIEQLFKITLILILLTALALPLVTRKISNLTNPLLKIHE
ncbi:MFS transporter [Dongshaea marina]|uniref:MFS transporter n=1 Tax=Dongshaea marina TaxID=2047966 RepID=UPI00131F0030|nr:MFS transporter [Dongshaea marina]